MHSEHGKAVSSIGGGTISKISESKGSLHTTKLLSSNLRRRFNRGILLLFCPADRQTRLVRRSTFPPAEFSRQAVGQSEAGRRRRREES